MIDALACSLSERKQQTLQERRGGKKRKQFYIYSENNRPGRNTHTKNKYTPVQRARVRVISFYFISLTYIQKEVQGNRRIRSDFKDRQQRTEMY